MAERTAEEKGGKRGAKPGPQVWSGSVGFGLVNVPVALTPATREMDYRFRELHAPDSAPIERRRYCSEEEKEVPREEVARGFELDDGRMVVLTEEDLEAAAPERTSTIEIEAFVETGEIDPVRFDRSYFAVPRGKSEGDLRAYALLVRAMEEAGRAAVGRFVLRTREHLVAVRAREGVLSVTTLLFDHDLRSAGDVEAGEADPPRRTVDEAVAVIEELSTAWQPDSYRDCYRERLGDVIKGKMQGRQVSAPKSLESVAARPTAAPDLMSALKRTLDEVRSRDRKRERHQRRYTELGRLSRDELYERAREAGLRGRSKMSKEDLRKALGRG